MLRSIIFVLALAACSPLDVPSFMLEQQLAAQGPCLFCRSGVTPVQYDANGYPIME